MNMEEQNQLAVVIANSQLEPVEGKALLERFGSYEEIAKDWEIKARAIVVTDASQIAEMKMAREGRLFLAQKRIDVEKARKSLKEQSLRKGQAIDAVAKFLVSLIEPSEKYLKEQEDFVEIQERKRLDELRIKEEERTKAERVAKEEAERAEQERIRQENAKLRAEIEEKEKAMLLEQRKQEKILTKEREAHETEKKVLIEKLKTVVLCPYCDKEFEYCFLEKREGILQ